MYKRFIGLFITFLFLLGSIVCFIVYKLDPLHVYKLQENDYFYATERYQMPGLVKHRDYDTIFVGTSMGRNFLEPVADEAFHTKTFNASLPASTAREQRMTADLAIQKKEVQHVIWELNFYSFFGEPDWVLEGSSPFPTYMYDQNKLNDLQYFFSPYSRQMAFKNWSSKLQGYNPPEDLNWLYKFGDQEDKFLVENAIKVIEATEPAPPEEGYSYEILLKSFEDNIISFIKDHPDTQFTFFYSPYPVTTHVVNYKMDAEYLTTVLSFKKEVYNRLKEYNNVKLYDFHDNKEITYNLSYYMWDQTHYYRFINDWIISQLTTTPPINDGQAYEQRLAEFENTIKHFDTNELKNEDGKPM
ncbi:hypothetical protein [Bacillus manliponensis]|uniref:hypothetical protein n=1 Tax=Bacillus manliponensis TaxID=574376 RepID=UPI0035112965